MWFAYIMIGNALWSIADVLMSMIVNRMDRSPVVIAWYSGVVEVTVLLLLYAFLPIETVWVGYFAVGALFAYVGMLLLFKLFSCVDVSVSSASWVFMSLGIAAGGMLFFNESWNMLQALGACTAIVGVLILSFWHKHVSLLYTCGLLAAVGFSYVPYFLIQKAALLSGVSVLTAFFWPILFQKLFAIAVPLALPFYRRQIRTISADVRFWFIGMLICWVCTALVGVYIVTKAYSVGDASLVGIAENGQPFFLIAFAWVATLFSPTYAPREILTSQSVSIKLFSFLIVFTGLTLLAVG
ncbi:hypothetical protein COU78_03055 [Candidatus Peregrinibacteria bacterium CG10_big_fil_rev_8_21_14_0_10_49_24]|nr:MAG: hypothetical protein COV83_06910 [Candidatus Peregrinibacteria bacterium CG11_big_fil_rev_8_21_14_0_20_49_14]PIR51106.1 MAG: hypothetical protein COU78_03055 [Candidatus Peregrinibacteria bacterium CG10_big_fil_rev_8_21_14_0_10_49_24]